MGAAWAFDPTITSKSGLLTSLDRARRQSTRRLPARCEALHRATLRIIASLGPQMGPQTHFLVWVLVHLRTTVRARPQTRLPSLSSVTANRLK